MSREIKFRLRYEFEEDKWEFIYRKIEDLYQEHLFINDILSQDIYIGLKDKNGKEIYEGDIVDFLYISEFSTEEGIEYEEIRETGVIIYNEIYARFDIKLKGLDECADNISETFEEDNTLEVIGNIYENPELLEV